MGIWMNAGEHQKVSKEEQIQRIERKDTRREDTHIVMTQNVVAALRSGTSPRHATPRTVSSFSAASGSPRHPQFQRLGPVERRQVDDRLLLVGMGKYMMEVTSASLVSRAQSLLTTAFSMVVGQA